MSWSHHVSSMASRARKVAACVLSAFKCRNIITMLTLYKSLVRGHLEYCCPMWNTSKSSDLMSMQRRRERYIIIHMWKILHQRCPNDLGIHFYSIKKRNQGHHSKFQQEQFSTETVIVWWFICSNGATFMEHHSIRSLPHWRSTAVQSKTIIIS